MKSGIVLAGIRPRPRAALQALLVTFLWSTSWVLIKIGLGDIPALTFAGLRYGLAFLCLLPFARHLWWRQEWRALSRGDWLRLLSLGLLFYTGTQGAQFVGLAYLPAVTVNLLLSLTPLIVALLGLVLLAERPTWWQWGGVGLSIVGAVIYFYPALLPAAQQVGLLAVSLGLCTNALSAVLGRQVNRDGRLAALTVTVISMGFGALVLLAVGLAVQGLPPLTPGHWAIIGWLAVVNTAFAFTLWNHTLRTLSAVESSVINGTMTIQIPILAWLCLEERLTGQAAIGLVLAGMGVLIVQVGRARGNER